MAFIFAIVIVFVKIHQLVRNTDKSRSSSTPACIVVITLIGIVVLVVVVVIGMLRLPSFDFLRLVVMLLPHVLERLLLLVLAVARIRRGGGGRRQAVPPVRHGLQLRGDVAPLGRDVGRASIFRMVLVGGAEMATGGDGFPVGMILVLRVGSFRFVDLRAGTICRSGICLYFLRDEHRGIPKVWRPFGKRNRRRTQTTRETRNRKTRGNGGGGGPFDGLTFILVPLSRSCSSIACSSQTKCFFFASFPPVDLPSDTDAAGGGDDGDRPRPPTAV